MIETAIPEGFERHTRQSGFTDPWEPLYAKREDGSFALGLILGPAHLNGRGMAHGGLIASLADNSMGIACAYAAGEAGMVTAQLSVNMVGSAAPGAWLQSFAHPTRIGGTLCFAEAQVTADGALVATATAIFRMAKR